MKLFKKDPPRFTIPLADIRTMVVARKHVGKLVDKKCQVCGSNLRIIVGPKAAFLGCPQYRTCGQEATFPWKNKKRGGWEEVVIVIDEYGERHTYLPGQEPMIDPKVLDKGWEP
jgi:ssDNA-binding Zn-finger/Zn-ribbon topoisomerase 1